MYGWRGRIGIILPADNGVLEPDFYRMAPEGVATHVARIHKAPRPDMPRNSLPFAETLKRTRVNVIGYMCAASTFMLGPQGNKEFCEQLTATSGGLPSFSATTAMVDALKAVSGKNIAVLAPHAPDIVAHLKSYIEQSGFNIAAISALALELGAINDTDPAEIYRLVRGLDTSKADAIFIAATNFRSIDVIEAIEADLGLPVVTSNQCALWKALQLLKLPIDVPGYGRLLRGA